MSTSSDWLNKYIGQTIQFNEHVGNHEIDFEKGMRATVVNVQYDEDDVWKVVVDFSAFVEHNLKLESPDYYDNNGKACLRWSETSYYPKNHRMVIYVDKEGPLMFNAIKFDYRVQLRESLMAQGFDRSTFTLKRTDGSYEEIWNKGQDSVTISWGPHKE